MELPGSTFVLRGRRRTDEDALVRHANDREIWLNLTDQFPHPYEQSDAREWLARDDDPDVFAIDRDGELVGVVGYHPKDDIHTGTATLGYWLARPLWGQGIATEAVRLVSDHAFSSTDLARLEAHVFEWNPASRRVLEKCGFACEARIPNAVLKDGKRIDNFIYGRLR